MHQMGAGIRQRQPICTTGEHLDVRLVANAVAGATHQRRMWLYADDAAGPLGESRQVKPVSAADVDDVGTTPVDPIGQCCP